MNLIKHCNFFAFTELHFDYFEINIVFIDKFYLQTLYFSNVRIVKNQSFRTRVLYYVLAFIALVFLFLTALVSQSFAMNNGNTLNNKGKELYLPTATYTANYHRDREISRDLATTSQVNMGIVSNSIPKKKKKPAKQSLTLEQKRELAQKEDQLLMLQATNSNFKKDCRRISNHIGIFEKKYEKYSKSFDPVEQRRKHTFQLPSMVSSRHEIELLKDLRDNSLNQFFVHVLKTAQEKLTVATEVSNNYRDETERCCLDMKAASPHRKVSEDDIEIMFVRQSLDFMYQLHNKNVNRGYSAIKQVNEALFFAEEVVKLIDEIKYKSLTIDEKLVYSKYGPQIVKLHDKIKNQRGELKTTSTKYYGKVYHEYRRYSYYQKLMPDVKPLESLNQNEKIQNDFDAN